MRAISLIFITAFPPIVFANEKTDPDCLNHLGGAFSSIECYNGLSKELDSINKSIAKRLLEKTPTANDKKLLKKYMAFARKGEEFCTIQKSAHANWDFDKMETNPRYHDYDVVYFECVYNKKKEQNKFLTQTLDYTNSD